MSEFFDTHFHLYPEDDLSLIAAAAHRAKVNWLTAVAVDLASSRQLIAAAATCCRRDVHIIPTVGVHPHEASRHLPLDTAEVQRLASSAMVKAVGEIGLDYHYRHSSPADQQEVFSRLLEVAVTARMPVIVHCREAYDDCFHIMQKSGVAGRLRILLHSYTGSAEWVHRFSRTFDAWFAFNGIVTFKKADNVRESLAAVPDHRLVLETDSPYLAPAPFRGQRNQPAWLPHIATSVAAWKNLPVEQLAALTTANARRFFAV